MTALLSSPFPTARAEKDMTEVSLLLLDEWTVPVVDDQGNTTLKIHLSTRAYTWSDFIRGSNFLQNLEIQNTITID
jgi:hypothetical protein